MEDDVFESYIEVDVVESIGLLDEASQDNKENESVVIPIQPVKMKAKTEQFDKILDFLKDNNEALMDTEEYNQLWSKLTCELNAMGPPSFSNSEWKRKWSDHKYNKKRKRNRESVDDLIHQAEPQHSIQSLDQMPVTNKPLDIDSENTRLLRVIVEKQDVLIERENVIIEKLDKFINLFEEFSKKISV